MFLKVSRNITTVNPFHIKACSVSLRRLGEDLSALKPVELLLVEVCEPVVVYLVGVTKESASKSVAYVVGHSGGSSKNTPLGCAQLCVSQVGQEMGSHNEEQS